MAGVSRLQYTTGARLIRVMCSGRVDPAFVLRAFRNGVDGVFIAGCRLDECNYITHGNYHALNMVLLYKKIMAHMGLNPERLDIRFLSSGEGNRFTRVVNEFVDRIKELGPLGGGEGIEKDDLNRKLESVAKLVPYTKIEKREKLASRLDSTEAYDGLFTDTEINELLADVDSYYIDPDKCRACMICMRKCPAEAITGGKNRIHVIDQEKCIKCGTCLDVCPSRFAAVQKIAGEPPPIPEKDRIIAKKSGK
jgi:coenzyme F420-reducing hydrogenase delta subunit/ferredoxin